MRSLAIETVGKIGQTVTIKGWVNSSRNHGGLIFIDVRDHTGVVQLVVQPEQAEAFKLAEELRDEFVIAATGTVRERSEELKNSHIETGTIEIKVDELVLLNRSEALPFQINAEKLSHEELRLRYRFLDLRRPKMQHMLKKHAEYYAAMRKYMEDHDFIEVATPMLASSSPEGARDFLIPSRVHAGKFYALPQAPQQFKQLLMVGGIPRYYQFAACFRDEDPRADRLYGEFYQLDVEMSFVEDGEEVRTMMEPLIKELVTSFAGKKLRYEQIPRIQYREAMDRFGSDKPDLRFDMELTELSEELAQTAFSVFKTAIESGGCVKAICASGAAGFSRSQIDQLTELAKSEGAGGLAYLTFEGGEVKSPIAKFMTPEELSAIQAKMGAKDGDIVFFGAGERSVVNKVLGRLRSELGDLLQLKDPNVIALAWFIDFPFYEWDVKGNKLDFAHNPFSMPKGGLEGMKTDDKLSIAADQYDMVMNGYEICSGAVRNHSPEILYQAFGALGYDRAYIEAKFGGMLNAFKFGAPPHAGCAFGVDRMFMVLMNEENIREIVAFPKNGSGIDVMMDSPSVVDDAQLKELHISRVAEK